MITKEKILDILEKHYHGRNHIESRCADELLGLIADGILALDSPTYGTKYKIRKGEKFLCLKDYVMNDDSIAYIKGHTYLADQDDCIQDEIDETNHVMTNQEDFFEYFKPLQ